MNNLELGKLPPQSIEFEEAVIGALMLESNCYIEICDILKPQSFYKDQHVKIYEAVTSVYSKNKPIDLLTVMEQLRIDKTLMDVGGMAYLTELTGRIGSSSHIEFHARIIQQKFIQRELIRISSEIQSKSYDNLDDVSDLLNFAESSIFGITQGNVKKEPKHIAVIGKTQLELLNEISNSKDEFTGIPTGLKSLDKVVNGFQANKLIILAARPAMGKTTLIVSISRNMAIDYGRSVAIFSLEMGEDEIWNKLASDITGITNAKIVSGKLEPDEWTQLEQAQRQLEESNIYIDDTAGITLFELRAKARRLKMKHDVNIIFIDYLQLMSGDKQSGNREQEISTISRGLKSMAKDLNIPVVALSQLNRSVETRPDKKPNLSDLRESGAIEQDADIVGFIYRPEEYGFETYEDGSSTRNKVDILLRKHRGGATGDVSLNRRSNFSRIYDEDYIEDIKPLEDNNDIKPDLEF